MKAYEKTLIVVREKLKEIFAEVYELFSDSEETRSYRPKDNGWTINEILEHISLTNYFLVKVLRHSYPKAIKRAKGKEINLGEESDLELLSPIGQKGAFLWARPEHMEPKGEKTLEEILTLLKEQEKECFGMLSKMENGEGSFCKIRMSVNDSGKIDLYQWLYFLALHSQRHLQQIAENKLEQKSIK